jgi:hypothetical protein
MKKYSGIATMYFKLNAQRRSILIGRAAMKSNRFARMLKRQNPIWTYIFRKNRLARMGGSAPK